MNGGLETISPATMPVDRRTSRLTWLYISALTAVAALSITGQLLVQRSLHQQRGDSTIVNIAGRQRMLSQKLTKAALAWSHATAPGERENRAEEIRGTLALWQRSHRGLMQGDAELSLVASRSPIVVAQFEKLQPIFAEMVSAADRLLASSETSEQQKQLRILLDREPVFLRAMDAAVFQLDHEAQARVARLQRIEWLLLTLTLAVLVGEGFLVFRPAVQRIHQTVHELQIAKEAAESANEQKTRFLATLSHELRNPLHAVLGNTELALESPLAPQQRLQIETIDESARSLLRLVNDLLDLACIQAGKLRIQPASFDLRKLTERCVDMVQPLAQRKHLQITLTADSGALLAEGDSQRVRQILLNLLGNAVKFIDQGSIQLKIVRGGTALRVEVCDTGPGITPALQQSIFAAFTQVDASTRREYSGVGLGLAISAGLVELMNGRIGVESEVGRGSCFWFDLPAATQAHPTEATSNAEPAAELAAGCRVLIAEDDVVNQRLLVDFLQVLGHSAVVAADGQQAVEQFQQQKFDLVLLDWHMPQLDGLDVARQIREWETAKQLPRTRLIAISAAADLAADKVQQAGVDEVLIKPVGLDQLRQALALFAGKSSTTETPSRERWSATLARMQGNWGLFRDVATLFLEQLPSELKRLEQLAAEQHFDELPRAAHLLKGQAANFDARELIAATEELELAAEAELAERVQASLQRINRAARQLIADLQQVLTELPMQKTAAVLSGRA
jgi:signal transduction histidine kinase/CheY-like chemotaxis protein/HPt (histidine-containing phosphotransfer) domain-containing protein